MATVLNRATKQLIPSANTADYPIASWIINPDLSAVAGFASKYWTITGDAVTLMTQAQRDAIDAAALAGSRDATTALRDDVEDAERAALNVILDEFNRHQVVLAAIFSATAAATSLADLKTRFAAISNVPTRTFSDFRTAFRNKLGT